MKLVAGKRYSCIHSAYIYSHCTYILFDACQHYQFAHHDSTCACDISSFARDDRPTAGLKIGVELIQFYCVTLDNACSCRARRSSAGLLNSRVIDKGFLGQREAFALSINGGTTQEKE